MSPGRTVCIVWGVMVVADSPQFSASMIELSEHAHVGTMVTFQTSVGFLVTLASIHVVPVFAALVGWRYAFAALAVGPALACLSVYRLRRHPAAVKLANGNR